MAGRASSSLAEVPDLAAALAALKSNRFPTGGREAVLLGESPLASTGSADSSLQ